MLTFRELALLKVRALTHDPPNKSFLLKRLGANFGEEHKRAAYVFRRILLKDTPLGDVGLREELESIVRIADRLASSFDRWVLRTLGWPSNSYVYYGYIHNVFNPNLRAPLGEVDETSAKKVAERVNRVIAELELGDVVNKVREREVLLYNSIYALLEASWYAEGLSPALADTRVPTHTVFDHLYATATAVNLATPASGGTRPGGFLVVVDYPGVQSFVNSGRKTGDLWAASWLLSNLMWGVASYFGLSYGYDVIVSPTPRLNPYALRSFVARLLSSLISEERLKLEYSIVLNLDGTLSSYGLNNLSRALTRDGGLLATYASAYGLGSYEELLELWLQPIVPATILMVLPAEVPERGTVGLEELLGEVTQAYGSSWSAIKGFVTERLGGSAEGVAGAPAKVIWSVLDRYSDILEAPPQTPSVAVVDLARVYEALVKCLEGDESLCDELGIDRRLVEGARALSKELAEGVAELASFLLWHVALSGWRALSRGPFGVFRSSLPRPFWYISGSGSLKPVHEGLESQPGGWVPCSLCGEEPAVLVARKSVDEKLGEVTFAKESLEMFERLTGTRMVLETGEVARGVVREIERAAIKPGEALGPYCAFKRAIYLASRERLAFVSTDDVALSGISRFLSSVDGELADRLIDSACGKVRWPECRDLVEEYLLLLEKPTPRTSFKDLRSVAWALRLRYEELRDGLTRALREACYEVVDGKGLARYFEEVARSLGLDRSSLEEPLRSLVDALREEVKRGHRWLVRRVCNFLSLRDVYAIIRGDADDVGEVLSGKRLACPRALLDAVVKLVEEEGEVVGDREGVLRALREGYERASKLLGGLEGSLLSPSITHSISLSLMLTAIDDWKTLRGQGVLVYSGGDDVYSLVALEDSLATALELRRNYFSEGFKRLRGQPVVPEIPTGRSFSVRFARLTDPLFDEVVEAARVLEEDSKGSVWKRLGKGGGETVKRKDSLTVSSSISGARATIPLDPSLRVAADAARAVPLLLLTVLSSNLPEDFREFAADPVLRDPGALERVFLYVLGRNISSDLLSREAGDSVRRALEELVRASVGLYVDKRGRLSSFIEELVNLVLVWRVVV